MKKKQDKEKRIKSTVRFARYSAQKARVLAKAIKGMTVEDAIDNLNFINKKIAEVFKKNIMAAAANAKNNYNINDNLYIKNIQVNQAPAMKRYSYRAMGRGMMIRKRMCHITIELDKIK